MTHSRPTVHFTSTGRIILGLLFAGLLFASVSARAASTTLYIGQNASGSADGSSCANQLSAAFFNSSGNWGSGSSQIGPGTTVHLCGTITSPLVAHGNGAASNPVTVVWEKGTSLSVCNTTGAFQLAGTSYLTLDLGGNSAAIVCPNNGTGQATQVNAIGIGTGGGSFSYVEIRNGTIGPLYQYACCGSDGIGSTAIYDLGGTNVHIHDLTMQSANAGVSFLLGNGKSSSGNEINNNICTSSVGRCIDYSNGTGSGNDTGARIHDNDITFGDGWYSGAGDYTHIESIRSFNYGGSGTDSISNLWIYNNYLHGVSSGDATSFIFIPNGLSCPSTNSSWTGKIFNNVFVLLGSSTSTPGDGFIFTQDCHHTIEIYNNTLDGGNNKHGTCMEFEGSNTITAKNNICMNAQTMIYNSDATPTLSADYNIYYNMGTSGANGLYWGGKEYTSLSNWVNATGNDSHSGTQNPGLNADYTISAGAAASGIGTNLTSLGVTQLNFSKPTSIGPGNDTAAGVPRSGSGNWDLGAYAVGNGTSPAPPTGLSASIL